MYTRFATRLRELRTDAGYSQRELAERLADATGRPVHQTHVSAWERGTVPAILYAVPLADALGVDVMDLLA